MPAPQLQHHKATAGSGGTTLVPAVPALRALVVSKLVVSNGNAAETTLTVSVGGTPVVEGYPLAGKSVYTEAGLVVGPGESVLVTSSLATNAHAFGIEQDRG